MLVKVNKIYREEKRVQVTLLDIDDLGSIIPLRELDLRISTGDDSIAETLINSPYAAIFTESNNNKDNGIIVIANAITLDEINREKTKTIDRAKSRSKGTATRSTL
jgi:hypothetical protein